MAVIVDNFSGTPVESKGLTIEIDYGSRTDGQPVYVGFASPDPDKTTADSVYKIMFCEYSGTLADGNLIRRTWADGNTNFDNVWDDRATLTYS